MIKYYRIFEVKEGVIALTDSTIANYYDTIEYAESVMESKYLKYNKDSSFTILPVYEIETDY